MMTGDEREFDNRPRGWIRFGGIATAIILPAFFAGIFSLIPNLFDRLFLPQAKLQYWIISSPAINVGSQFTSIYSLQIVNTGSAKITGVDASVFIQGGSVAKATIGENGGDRPTINGLDSGTRLTIRSMFPQEKLTAAILVSATSPSAKPVISVRSDQVLGKLVDPSIAKETDLPTWFAIFPALGALIASLLMLLQLRTKIRRVRGQLRLVYKGSAGVDRDDAIGFIAMMIGNEKIESRLRDGHSTITYARFCDIIAQFWDSSDAAERDRLASGLKSVAAIPFIADTSRIIALDYLNKLASNTDLKPSDVIHEEMSDPVDFRKVVRTIFSGTSST